MTFGMVRRMSRRWGWVLSSLSIVAVRWVRVVSVLVGLELVSLASRILDVRRALVRLRVQAVRRLMPVLTLSEMNALEVGCNGIFGCLCLSWSLGLFLVRMLLVSSRLISWDIADWATFAMVVMLVWASIFGLVNIRCMISLRPSLCSADRWVLWGAGVALGAFGMRGMKGRGFWDLLTGASHCYRRLEESSRGRGRFAV